MSLTIAVIGAGCAGVVHAVCMADLGHTVVVVDPDAATVESLSRGVAPMFEPGLDELLARVLPAGRLRFTTDYAEASDADVHFLCEATPQCNGGVEADMSYIFAAVQSLAPHLAGRPLVVGKSTVPVGTATLLRDSLRLCAPKGVRARLAWNPEFLREGFAIQDTMAPDRFVYGVDGPSAEADVALLDEVYAGPLASGTPRLVTDFPTAELGAAEAVESLHEIDTINLRQRARMVELAREQCGGTLVGKRVAVLGAAFTPDSDDIRDSPALDIAQAARKEGAYVTVHDPKAMDAAQRAHPDLDYADSVEEACLLADVVLHLTAWKQFSEIDPAKLAVVVANPTIVDGRNTLDSEQWSSAGWSYRALGRATV